MQRLFSPLSFLQSTAYRSSSVLHKTRPGYCKTMSSEQPPSTGTHKDPVTGEMVSKQCVWAIVVGRLSKKLICGIKRT